MNAVVSRTRREHLWRLSVASVVLVATASYGGGDDTASTAASDSTADTGAIGGADAAESPDATMGSDDAGATGDDAGTEAAGTGQSVSGRFTATPGQGYTVEISYELENLSASVDIADALPDEANLSGAGVGELSVRNTTADRNVAFSVFESFRLTLLYEETQLPFTPTADTCSFTFRGVTYYCLARIFFELPNEQGSVSLGPDDSLTMPVLSEAALTWG